MFFLHYSCIFDLQVCALILDCFSNFNIDKTFCECNSRGDLLYDLHCKNLPLKEAADYFMKLNTSNCIHSFEEIIFEVNEGLVDKLPDRMFHNIQYKKLKFTSIPPYSYFYFSDYTFLNSLSLRNKHTKEIVVQNMENGDPLKDFFDGVCKQFDSLERLHLIFHTSGGDRDFISSQTFKLCEHLPIQSLSITIEVLTDMLVLEPFFTKFLPKLEYLFIGNLVNHVKNFAFAKNQYSDKKFVFSLGLFKSRIIEPNAFVGINYSKVYFDQSLQFFISQSDSVRNYLKDSNTNFLILDHQDSLIENYIDCNCNNYWFYQSKKQITFRGTNEEMRKKQDLDPIYGNLFCNGINKMDFFKLPEDYFEDCKYNIIYCTIF